MVRESPWRIDVENFHKMHNTGCARCWDVKGPSVKDTMPLGSGDRDAELSLPKGLRCQTLLSFSITECQSRRRTFKTFMSYGKCLSFLMDSFFCSSTK